MTTEAQSLGMRGSPTVAYGVSRNNHQFYLLKHASAHYTPPQTLREALHAEV